METAVEVAQTAAKKVAQGQHIYVYNNFRTNQVVYSLTRSIKNNDALAQLTYTGKNSVPRAIRKDLWRPLLTVSFPSALQGLSAYRKLREFRRLHETTWSDADVAARRQHVLLGPGKFRNKDKEEEDGEDWWRDIERKPGKKEKKMMLMDQKANSIADLAAVLFAQERQGVQREEGLVKRAEEEAKREKERWARLEELAARAKGGEVERLNEQIKKLEAELAAQKEKENVPGEQGKKPDGKEPQLKPEGAQELELKRLRRQKHELLHAKNQIEKRAKGEIPDTTGPDVVGIKIEKKAPWPPPKYGPLRKQALKREPYLPTTEGVRIQWANIVDAEFAESWPSAVAHEIMGYFRHQAPHADPRDAKPKTRMSHGERMGVMKEEREAERQREAEEAASESEQLGMAEEGAETGEVSRGPGQGQRREGDMSFLTGGQSAAPSVQPRV
ncbi:hypothetical protein H2201_005907 [Coniosporium apollinis]|uniref:Large ribosomal subunit protein mL67 n=1 Tax=Coniosporium apollinis TaxID=61459 RepID=A0ABQ9NRX3_9PEZI|nr:hypothetical protein H2201_005907 [Coniosporium apollinis]